MNLCESIIHCQKCPRLRAWCENVGKTPPPRYAGQIYWTKPVPNFGDPSAQILIIGLAPAAHGANRTGRMFTGDRSGEWLYKALHQSGFTNQPTSNHIDDGLILTNVLITALAHCAPPQNKPATSEFMACKSFLQETIHQLKNLEVVIALGGLAYTSTLGELKKHWGEPLNKAPKFTHGVQTEWANNKTLIASYHPSQQNTFTGKLTEPMFNSIFEIAKKHIQS